MAEILPYGALSMAVVAIWFTALVHLEALTPQDVRAWRRLAALRGFATPRGRLERVATRLPLLRRLQEELDLYRLLAVANRRETPLAFLAGAASLGFLTAAVTLAADVAYHAAYADWLGGVGPWIALLALPLVPALLVAVLRQAARRRQERAGRALGDTMMLVAIMTDGRGLQLDDAVRILARCMTNDALTTLVEPGGWRALVRTPHRSTIDLYRSIAAEYRIPLFATVADAAANANLGFSERETYTAVARAVYAERLSQARVRAARAKTLVTLPIAAMLLPLLLLLGAPAVSTITSGLGGR
ncbi:MAG: hypothetical protein ABR564_00150 [Candidatus Dormibacteria bacterium]